jgi:hypothetical protein
MFVNFQALCTWSAGIMVGAEVAAIAHNDTDGAEAEVEAALPDFLISMLLTLRAHRPAALTFC